MQVQKDPINSQDLVGSLNSRRRFLKMATGGMAVASAGAMGLLAGCQPSAPTADSTSNQGKTGDTKPASGENQGKSINCVVDANSQVDFFGKHQAGIVTPAQRHVYFLVADLHTEDVQKIKAMFQTWTAYATNLTQGKNVKEYGNNHFVPPVDTGEADSLAAYDLTLTFGIAPSFLKKLGLSDKAPKEFVDLPKFPRDQIRKEISGGDLCIQACANDPQVAFHAIRQLVRVARGNITMRWSKAGFLGYDSQNETARNLFAFKDGTANQKILQSADKDLWVDADNWLKNGSYLVVRTIQMHLETWDRTSLAEQQRTFGRTRPEGAPLGKDHEFDDLDLNAQNDKGEALIPEDSHVALAHKTGLQMLRRSYSYADGIDRRTGQFDAGLLFISFQKNPDQFVVIQNALGNPDRMNEYITHIGSGLFACFAGVSDKEDDYLGKALFEG